jgi:hypothetical protein
LAFSDARTCFGGGDRELAELHQGGGAGVYGDTAGPQQLPDRLHDAGGVLRDRCALAGEHLTCGGLGVDRVALATPGAGVGMRLVDLDHRYTGRTQVTGQPGAI